MKKFLFRVVVVALLATVCVPSSSGFAMAKKPKIFEIQIKVDFGPAAKPGHSAVLTVEKGTTLKEAVMQVYPVKAGKSCCSFREVVEIDGVRTEPENSNWWICLLNGSKNVDPRKKTLSPGDVLEWKYIHEERCPLDGSLLKK